MASHRHKTIPREIMGNQRSCRCKFKTKFILEVPTFSKQFVFECEESIELSSDRNKTIPREIMGNQRSCRCKFKTKFILEVPTFSKQFVFECEKSIELSSVPSLEAYLLTPGLVSHYSSFHVWTERPVLRTASA